MDDIKSPGTYWLSIMKFTFVFWTKNMCIRQKFSKVGFFLAINLLEGCFR